MFEELLQRIAQALTDADIGYMVIGGQAVLLYGEPRLTKDVDVTLALTPDQAWRILKVAELMDWKVLPENPLEFVTETFVLPVEDSKSGVRIDLIFSYTPFERDAIAHAHLQDIGGVAVAFVSPEDLVVHKIFAGRPRDLEDVVSVLLKQPGLDRGQVRNTLAVLSEGGISDFVSRFEEVERTLTGESD